MALTDEQKRRILEEEQQRLAEEQFRARMHRELREGAKPSRSIPRKPIIILGSLLACLVIALSIGEVVRFRQPAQSTTPNSAGRNFVVASANSAAISAGENRTPPVAPGKPGYAASAGRFRDLTHWEGEYANQGLLELPDLRKALRQLMGAGTGNLAALDQNMGTCLPITLKHGILTATGCRPHFCNEYMGAITVNLRSSEVRAFVFSDHHITAYSQTAFTEDQLPEDLQQWIADIRNQSPQPVTISLWNYARHGKSGG